MTSTDKNHPNWSIGDELAEIELEPVTRMDLIKYAGASGDYNPIHTVDDSAREAGLPGVIAHGMLTAATVGRLFYPYLEHGYVSDLGVRFVGMVHLGDAIRVGGSVTDERRENSGAVYGFEVYARTGEDTVVTGTAEFTVYD